MSFAVRRTCSLVLLALIGVLSLTAQQSQPPTQATAQFFTTDPLPTLLANETIRKRVDEVNLIFTVTDHRGRFVSSLTEDEFKILDNKMPPESVSYFQEQTQLPLRVGLLVDVSDSVTYRFAFEQKAAATFLQRILRSSDTAMIIGFNKEVYLQQGFTNNPQLLERAIYSLRPRGETALFDAVKAACEKLGAQPEEGVTRRAIVLITDGMDNESHAGLKEAIAAALRSEVVIYALSTNPDLTINPTGEETLKQLSDATGGRVLRAQGERDIAKAFAKIQEELRSQYAVGYKPADLKSGYRSIQIKTKKHRVRVRYRTGYYAMAD